MTHPAIKQRCVEIYKKSLIDGKSVIVDAQNEKNDLRIEWIQSWKHYGAKIIRCVFIDIPKKVIMYINRVRSHYYDISIPNFWIHSFYKQLDSPTVKEGFDVIIKYILNDFYFSMKEITMTFVFVSILFSEYF